MLQQQLDLRGQWQWWGGWMSGCGVMRCGWCGVLRCSVVVHGGVHGGAHGDVLRGSALHGAVWCMVVC